KPGTTENGSASDVEDWADTSGDSDATYTIENVVLHYELKEGPVVATDGGEPMVKEIKVKREIVPYKYVPKLKYLEELYNIFTANYEVIPISEANLPDYSNGATVADVTLNDESNGIGLVTLEENWKENFTTLDSKTETYKVSYYTEEDYKKLGRRISRIEWKQDWGNVVNAAGASIFDSLISADTGSGGGGGSSKEALWEWIVPLAQQLQKESGLLPSLTIAQKIQESGWDWTDSTIETECHNYWGMKAGGSWDGDSMVFNTKEDDGSGNLYSIQDAFRKYDSDEAGFSGRGEWFWSYSRYRNVLLACIDGDWEAAVDDFTTNGYATDIHYAESLKKIIEQNELWQYDDDPAYQFDGVPPEYARYDPYTGDSLGGGSSGSGAGLASGVEFETDPYYSKFKDNEIYPEKTVADLAKAYRNYANGKGYSYDDLYFAFYQIDKYYPEGYFTANNSGIIQMGVDIPIDGFAWPVELSGNPDAAIINCLYGYTAGYGRTHSGVDISRGNILYREGGLSKGPKIVAAHDGKVVMATANPTSDSDGYTYVEIQTTDGKYITQYGHLSEIHVTTGQEVMKGQVIGVMGTTGNSTGVHLHYAMFDTSNGDKVRIDPLQFYELSPEYGSIDRATITGLPTGYRYIGSKTNSSAGGGSSTIPSNILNASKDEKLAYLFPSGLPQSASAMSQYLVDVQVPTINKNGNKVMRTLTVHKAVAKDVVDIYTEIAASGFPIYDTYAYSWRSMAASGSRSHHSYGIAIDINANENYMVKNGRVIAGSLWEPGRNPYSITPNGPVVKAFKARGWEWGGNWRSSKDYMHFSFTGY
ncbi:MAG: peptidoglycan DD-metalloendopeptidase family protein, partial [Clostridia bacterium]|nr:peptidoglycan DD-metalloendopeptidase family protein [Clostridia bacterium]